MGPVIVPPSGRRTVDKVRPDLADDSARKSGRAQPNPCRTDPLVADYSVLAIGVGGAVLASRLWWIVAISHSTTMAAMTTA